MRLVAGEIGDTLIEKFDKMANDPACSRYVMKPYIAFFSELLLSKDTLRKDLAQFMEATHLDASIYEGRGVLFNVKDIYNDHQAKKWQIRKMNGSFDTSVNSVACIPVISDAVCNALSRSQPVSPDSFETGVIETLLAKQNLPTDDAQLKVLFAHYLNELNSRRLHAWIADFNVDIERKAEDEQAVIKKNVAWILRDAQVKGLFIFITLLMNILLFCCVIMSTGIIAKQKARELALTVVNKEDAETLKRFLDTRLRLIQLYLFPVVTFVAIIIALLIPLMKPINVLEINASKPGWFLSLSNWNVAGAVTETILELPVSKTAEDNAKAVHSGVVAVPATAPPSVLTDDPVTREEFRDAVTTITRKIDSASNDAKAIKQYVNHQE